MYAVTSKLEPGAKIDGRSSAWFGRKTRQRKDDAVLRYIKAARNSDEHGIERVTERADAGWGDLHGRLKFGEQFKTTVATVDQTTLEPNGPEVTAYIYGPYLKAITAHDRRFNVRCDPPQLHERDGNYPPDIAEVALEKLRAILEEAANLV